MVVLVAYATAHGATQEVAERIGDRLQRRGITVEVRTASDARNTDRYGPAVLGSAVHGGNWLPAAVQLMRREAASLRGRPVWLFSVSSLGDEESMFGAWVAKRLRAFRKETREIVGFRSTIGVREHRNFAGAIARSDWPLPGRILFRAMGGHYGDHRNWATIDRWADHIAAQILSPAVGPDRAPQHD